LIVTADEALDDEGEITVALPGGEISPASVVGRDSTTDVALLRVDRTNPPSVTLESASVAAGALVCAVGSQQGASIAAFGAVSFVARANEGADVALVPSHSGEKTAEQDAALTPREIQVLNLLAEGASNKSIARRLGISVHTVKFHVASLLDKFEAIGRTDAVTQAVRLGMIQL
jgi:DNA-binding CsgD family transcriptional regulator